MDDSNGSAQVGSPAASAPVRVISEGDQTVAGPGQSGGGGQSAQGTDGSAQVGSPVADVATRVLSGGDDETAAPSGQDQTVRDGTGVAQVGGPRVRPAVRVLSVGDEFTPAATLSGAGGPAAAPGVRRRVQHGSRGPRPWCQPHR